MYEGKLPRREAATPLDSRSESEALRAIDWTELVARLAAARDARASLLTGDPNGEASFDAGSALRIAQREADELVNPEDSANLKRDGRTSPDAPSAGQRRAPRDQ